MEFRWKKETHRKRRKKESKFTSDLREMLIQRKISMENSSSSHNPTTTTIMSSSPSSSQIVHHHHRIVNGERN
ncbi:hypothetical protein MtrunA17_Chr4g0031391 [Medicago truncatula]|uniref:Uncharacterized protein n=1 Tax=Medicago truncatula TaxID=3880 RepID=A0A396I5S1_MEDTR|nr:hypothetical protein MtrunA17_Chr4g0031391 [Medicago truncatula]